MRLDFGYENSDTYDFIELGIAEVDSSRVFSQVLATLGCVKLLIARSVKRYCDMVELLTILWGTEMKNGGAAESFPRPFLQVHGWFGT